MKSLPGEVWSRGGLSRLREGNLPQDYVIMRMQAGGGKVVLKSKSLVLRPFLRDKFKVLNSQSLVLRLFFRDKL